MIWDQQSFKALVDGVFDESNNNSGAESFLILADAFDDEDDARGRMIRQSIRTSKAMCLRGHHHDPFGIGLKNLWMVPYFHYLELAFKRMILIHESILYQNPPFVLPGQEWSYEKSWIKFLWEYCESTKFNDRSRFLHRWPGGFEYTLQRLKKSGIKIDLKILRGHWRLLLDHKEF